MAQRQAIAMAGMSSEAYEGTYRPVGEGKSVRLPFSLRPVLRPADETRPADRLVGQALGLGRYMDRHVVNAARREIEEAFQLDDTEIDAAAVGLSRGEDGVADSLPLPPEYMQHAGMTEMRDYNEYSRSSLLRPAPTQQDSRDSRGSDSQEDLLLVTTL
ncbi:hypothetical protein WR25_15942 [Diploscapter pachys]|uniref:Uncharacterized protein n=1 Tax=Diploscapter pachys TaxID=2018661 RepID=A0A2A2LBN5_9BILA|nr:hypothetical protein WR25_15942 [Diploscapter pachys]